MQSTTESTKSMAIAYLCLKWFPHFSLKTTTTCATSSSGWTKNITDATINQLEEIGLIFYNISIYLKQLLSIFSLLTLPHFPITFHNTQTETLVYLMPLRRVYKIETFSCIPTYWFTDSKVFALNMYLQCHVVISVEAELETFISYCWILNSRLSIQQIVWIWLEESTCQINRKYKRFSFYCMCVWRGVNNMEHG